MSIIGLKLVMVVRRHLGFMLNTGGKLPKLYYFRDFRLKSDIDKKENPE
jgi:hypothetical protein